MNNAARTLGLLATTVALLCPAIAPAQTEYPTKPIRLVTPFAAGATTDVLSRIISQNMQADWGQPVIVDNKPGAAGLVGTEIVAKAPPDGYTLVNVISSHLVHKDLVRQVPFDAIRDFEPVIHLARTPLTLVVSLKMPVTNTQEFIALMKKNPGKYGYGTSGVGSAVHLTMEQFKQLADIDVAHVPYKGGAPALQDLLGGHVEVVMSGLFTVTQALKANQIRALFVTGAKRSPIFPDIPTAQEAGFPGFVADEWWGILAPKGTPPAIIAKLNAEITHIFNQPDVKAKIDQLGIEFIGGTPAQFGEFMQKEAPKWSDVLKKAGVKPE